MTIGRNPLPAVRRWRGQRQIEDGDFLSLLSASTDRNDFVRVSHINAFDTNRCPQNLRGKGDRQMLLERTEETDELFGFAVGVDDGFVHEFVQPAFVQ